MKSNEHERVDLHYISDPGHGWLRVSVEDLRAAGVDNNISDYSFLSPAWASVRYAYLEHDSDAPIFLNALKNLGYQQGVDYVIVDEECADFQRQVVRPLNLEYFHQFNV
jgi:hypothetical protein